MSFDAMRQVWAMRDAGELPGGTTLLVLVALADAARRPSDEATASLRFLGDRVGRSHQSVVGALRDGVDAGLIELARPGRGTRPAVYRFTGLVVPEPTTTGYPQNGPAVGGPTTNGRASGRLVVRGRTAVVRGRTASARETDQLPGQVYPETTSRARAREAPGPVAAALALMVGVETHLEEMRGGSRRPAAVAATIERRVAGTFGVRLAGMLSEGMSTERAAAAALVEDGVGGVCPHEGCRALDARPITDASRCARRHSCPFYVGLAGERGEVLL